MLCTAHCEFQIFEKIGEETSVEGRGRGRRWEWSLGPRGSLGPRVWLPAVLAGRLQGAEPWQSSPTCCCSGPRRAKLISGSSHGICRVLLKQEGLSNTLHVAEVHVHETGPPSSLLHPRQPPLQVPCPEQAKEGKWTPGRWEVGTPGGRCGSSYPSPLSPHVAMLQRALEAHPALKPQPQKL